MAWRQLLHRYVPANLHDPVGLASRLLRTGDPSALFAMATAAGGLAMAPLDAALAPWERRFVRREGSAQFPLLFICGAPRSGTTLAYQTLTSHLPVAYFSNLTSLFPRAPLVAHSLLQRFAGTSKPTYASYYGRTRGLAGANDALYLWDRWLGADRSRPPKLLTEPQRRDMRAFFAACDVTFGRPLVNKNNSLNLSAHLVAECLPHARFICMTRESRPLARSLYRARCDIHGGPTATYGVGPQDRSGVNDPVRSVCQQAVYHDQVNQMQCERLGPNRFWPVSYEQFCRNPAALVRRVAAGIFGDEGVVTGTIPRAFVASSADRVPPDVAARIDSEFDAMERSNDESVQSLVATA
jgi:hypothetical protein